MTLADSLALHDTCWPNWPLDTVGDLLLRVQAMMDRKRGLGVVGTVQGVPVAYGQLTLWPHTAEISDLIVSEVWRAHGIGTAIICHLIDVARTWSVPTVEIGAALSNPRALALYRRLGFRDERTIELDLGGGAEPVMYLKLPL